MSILRLFRYVLDSYKASVAQREDEAALQEFGYQLWLSGQRRLAAMSPAERKQWDEDCERRRVWNSDPSKFEYFNDEAIFRDAQSDFRDTQSAADNRQQDVPAATKESLR